MTDTRDYVYCVLVTGGRDYADGFKVFQCLDALAFLCGGDIMLMHGGARGADSLAEAWAIEREQISVRVPAQWSKFGNRAGPKRNALMAAISQAHYVVAFAGGRGTRNMLSLAEVMEPKPQILLPDGEFWK